MRLRIHIIVLMVLGALIVNNTIAQNKQLEIANEYFNKADYEKAATLYEKLSKKKELQTVIYENYRTSLLKLGTSLTLKKWIIKIKKDHPDDIIYEVDYNLLYQQGGDEKQYNKSTAKLIDKSKYSALQVDMLASAMNKRLLYSDIILLYTEARKTAESKKYSYAAELAVMYKFINKKKLMIDEYINAILDEPSEAQFIKNSLQAELDQDGYIYLEEQLYQRLSEQSSQLELAKTLVWHYTQLQDFYNAFVQERSIDKKLNLHGKRVFELGNVALKNRDYKNAITIFGYIASAYDDNFTYVRAKKQMIIAQEAYVRSLFPVDTLKVEEVIASYHELLTKTRRLKDKTEIKRNTALLYAFYLHNNDSAIAILNTIIKQPRTDRQMLAQSKLDLGDIYLLNNTPWESTLLYSQVEKMIKDDRLGHLAKLKNAKLSFYRGDFELAQANLDILKLATSREIANDAMDLSLLIQDNLALDTSDLALSMYSRADLLLFQKKFTAAQLTLDTLTHKFYKHTLNDEVYWLKSKIAHQIGNYEKEEGFLIKIIEKYKEDILGDDALFALANLYEDKLNRPKESMELFKQLLIDFPGSIYVAEARKHYRKLRGDQVN